MEEWYVRVNLGKDAGEDEKSAFPAVVKEEEVDEGREDEGSDPTPAHRQPRR